MAYTPGTKYIQNSITGAVFGYRDSIVGKTDLQVMVADGAGNLVKENSRAEDSTAKLNPTKTPEKREAPSTKPTAAQATKQPTMKPVDVKMKTVDQYVTDTSGQLNDQYIGREFLRWNRALLLTYLNGALAELSSYKPEAFVTQIDTTLVAGRRQTLADSYKSLVSVDTNADGTQVHESDIDLIRAFAPYSCCAGEVVFDSLGSPKYTARSFAIDPKAPKVFFVSPEVPAGLTPVVKATVIAEPVKYTLANFNAPVPVDAKYEENILDYMMGRAFDIDSESPMSRSNADKHLNRFYTAMGVKYRVESAYRAGNYNGSIGDGNPRATL